MKYVLPILALILVSCSGNGTSVDENVAECTLTVIEFEESPNGDILGIAAKGSSFDAKTSLAQMCTIISSWDDASDDASDEDATYCVIKRIYQRDGCAQ